MVLVAVGVAVVVVVAAAAVVRVVLTVAVVRGIGRRPAPRLPLRGQGLLGRGAKQGRGDPTWASTTP